MSDKNKFSQKFTKKYSLSKTLRFELKPIWKTQEMLDENKVFQTDKIIKDKYIKTKPFFDQLHRDFIKESLEWIDISGLNNFYENWKAYRKDRKWNEKNYKKACENLRKEVVSFFDAGWKKWAESYKSTWVKNQDIEILFEEGIFKVLRIRYWNDETSQFTDIETWEITSIFDWWKGFTGYFTKFFETRKNFYKTDGTSTAIATRIVDQNLSRFLDNLEIIEKIKSMIDFTEIAKNFEDFEKFFTLDFYNNCILQNGIDKYNNVLGWYTTTTWEKIKWINELINSYRQTHKEEKISFLKLLDKQIGSEKLSFIETIDSLEEFRSMFSNYVTKSNRKILILQKLYENFFNQTWNFELSHIYIAKEAFNTISYKWTDYTKQFQEALYDTMKKSWASYDKKEDEYKFPDFIALSQIKSSLESIKIEWFFWKNRYLKSDENKEGILALDTSLWECFLRIFEYEFNSLFKRSEKDEIWNQKLVWYNTSQENINYLLQKEDYNTNSEENKAIIKAFADDTLRIYQMWKYFAIEKKRQWNPDDLELWEFYTQPEVWYEFYYSDAYKIIVQWYNDIRNYLTKNPWSEDKWKLNFDHSKLLWWFTESKTENSNNGTQYGAYILRKKGRFGYSYYLGISKNAHLVSYFDLPDNSWDSEYERLNYYQIKTNSIYWTSYDWDYKKDKEELTENEIIQKIKNALSSYKARIPEIEGLIQKKYLNLKEIQKDIDIIVKEKWKIFQYKHISKEQLKIAYQSKHSFYIFQIYNKDFELDSSLTKEWYTFKAQKGQQNTHTKYFNSLVSWVDWIIDIWVWEIFFREKTKKENLKSKEAKNKKIVLDHKRYWEDKVLLHLSIVVNDWEEEVPKKEGARKAFCWKFNTEVNNFLAQNPDINIIWVDRWEKHLAYYSVINQKWDTIESDTLNTVNGVNYGKMLEDTAEKRKQARQDWQAVEGIKNQKKWYVSAVVRKLADLAIKHNAIIVFEDLNMRFKQIRWGIEKSVYQQLEKALIEKLNFLVNKWELDSTKAGHLLNAYQLTAPFETFKDMGKQTGIIFYTQAAYTSKIDPVNGWRPHLYLKYSSAEQAKKEILKLTNITFNQNEKRFEFTYDIKNFSIQKEFPKKTIWTVCSNVERYRWDKTLNLNKGDYTPYKTLTPNFEEIFTKYDIDFKNWNIIEQIKKIEPRWNETFFRSFLFFFSLICQIRNVNKNDSNENQQDFILSPVEPFFDSRKSEKFWIWLPKNGDENGAYNIARKGIMILNKINNFSKENWNCEKMKWSDLSVSNTEWDDFASKKS